MAKKTLESAPPGLQIRKHTTEEYERKTHAGLRIKEIMEAWAPDSKQSRASTADSHSLSAAIELLENLDPSEAVALLRAGEASPLLQRVLADWITGGCKRPKHRSRNSHADKARYDRALDALALYEDFLAATPTKRTRAKNGGAKGHTTPAERAFEEAVSWTAKAEAVHAAKGNAAEQEKLIDRISQQLKNDLRELIEGRWRKCRFRREPREE